MIIAVSRSSGSAHQLVSSWWVTRDRAGRLITAPLLATCLLNAAANAAARSRHPRTGARPASGRQLGAAVDRRHRQIQFRPASRAGQRHSNRMKQRLRLLPRLLLHDADDGAERLAALEPRRAATARAPGLDHLARALVRQHLRARRDRRAPPPVRTRTGTRRRDGNLVEPIDRPGRHRHDRREVVESLRAGLVREPLAAEVRQRRRAIRAGSAIRR